MYVYMGHMRWSDIKPYEDWFWIKNRIDLVEDWVTSIDYQKKSINTKSGKSFSFDKLILALGSKPNKFGWPGQELKAVQGLYSKQDLESLEEISASTKQAVIVGGGLIGVELAEMLLSRGINESPVHQGERATHNGLETPDAFLSDVLGRNKRARRAIREKRNR